MASTFSCSVSSAPSLSPSLPFLVLYLDGRLRVISFQLGSIFEIIFWEEAIRIETFSSPSSPGVHSSLRRLEKIFIAPAVRRQCLWRICVRYKAAREKTKKADKETKNSQAFTSIQTVKWCCLTYDISEANDHFCCFCLWRGHSNFLFKSTHYRKE